MLDFSVDKRIFFPNQLINGETSACVGLTVCNLSTNKSGILFDGDFSYAMAFRLLGKEPNTVGVEAWAGMQAGVAYGLLPASLDTMSALVDGELYVAQWLNYPQSQRDAALPYARNGAKRVNVDFDVILAEVAANKEGVGLELNWYASYKAPDALGRLPSPSGARTEHMVTVTGQVTIEGEVRMEIKPYLGKEYGVGGFSSLSRAQFYQCAFGAYAYNDSMRRWWSLVGIAITYKYPYLSDYAVELMTIDNTSAVPLMPEPQQGKKGISIYNEAKLLLNQHISGTNPRLGCAVAVNYVVKQALGYPIGGGASTALMNVALHNTNLWTPVQDPLYGDIVMCPTGESTFGPTFNGHVGVVAKHGFLSNNSETGLFGLNYTRESWEASFLARGFQTHYYRAK